jgi:hypothetical protein
MINRRRFVSVVVIVSFLLYFYPDEVHAQRSRSEQKDFTDDIVATAIADAKADAREDVNKNLWAACGCLVPVIGVVFAYLTAYPCKEENLIGKSPEYVEIYHETYRQETRKIKTGSAIIGCMASTICGLIIYGCYSETKDCGCMGANIGEDFWSCNW